MQQHSVSVHATADILADIVKAQVNCDRVLVSFGTEGFLYSVGLDSVSHSTDFPRIHQMSDTVCSHTISKGEPLKIADATADPVLRDLKYVKNGGVRGYLGAPIRNFGGWVTGAICAISDTPRQWSDKDRALIEGMSLALRHAISLEQMAKENAELQKELHIADEAMMVLSQTTKPMTSVHRKSGALAFVSKSLSHFLDEAEIEKVIRSVLKGVGSLEVTQEEPSVGAPILLKVSDVFAKARNGKGVTFSAVVSRASDGMLHVVWKIERELTVN